VATRQVVLPEIGDVTLYKRRGNRSLRISVGADGVVRVSMPYWLPYRAGEQFALSKQAWIVGNQRRSYRTSLEHGHGIGKAHRLVFNASAAASKVSTRIVQNEIRIEHPLEVAVEAREVQRAAQTAAVRALRKEAEALLPQRLQMLAEQTGLDYAKVSVKQLKSRWGSCSSTKEITLNLYLMQLPWHLIDYVLIHELSHTRVMRHGAPFWEEMERHVSQPKKLRREIGEYQPALTPRTI